MMSDNVDADFDDRDFFEFPGLSITGPDDVVVGFVDDIGFLCDELNKLRDELWPLKSGSRRLAAFAERLDNAGEHALDVHRVALRATGCRVFNSIEEAFEPDEPN